MFRIDNSTVALVIPTPAAVGPHPNGFFTKGNPGTGVPATIVDDDWANAVQEEICYCIEQAGLTLSKTDRTQLKQAMQILSGKSYTHTQGSSNATWTITHNLGTKNHQIQVRDGSDLGLTPDTITIGTNTDTLTFTDAITGTAFLNT